MLHATSSCPCHHPPAPPLPADPTMAAASLTHRFLRVPPPPSSRSVVLRGRFDDGNIAEFVPEVDILQEDFRAPSPHDDRNGVADLLDQAVLLAEADKAPPRQAGRGKGGRSGRTKREPKKSRRRKKTASTMAVLVDPAAMTTQRPLLSVHVGPYEHVWFLDNDDVSALWRSGYDRRFPGFYAAKVLACQVGGAALAAPQSQIPIACCCDPVPSSPALIPPPALSHPTAPSQGDQQTYTLRYHPSGDFPGADVPAVPSTDVTSPAPQPLLASRPPRFQVGQPVLAACGGSGRDASTHQGVFEAVVKGVVDARGGTEGNSYRLSFCDEVRR